MLHSSSCSRLAPCADSHRAGAVPRRCVAVANGRRFCPLAAVAAERGNLAAAKQSATWRVFNGTMPLIGFEKAVSIFKGTPIHAVLQGHTYTVLAGPDQVWSFDFLPLQPTSPATGLLLLTAGSAPGEVRVKRLALKNVNENDNMRLIGKCRQADPLAVAQQYNRSYNKQLHLLLNNCKHHTTGLTQVLTESTQ